MSDADELTRDLKHADPAVRCAAATALTGHTEAALAVASLVELMRDTNADVRRAAAAALKQLALTRGERFKSRAKGISPGEVALKGTQSVGCIIQLVFGLLALVALVLKIFVALN